MSILTDIFNWIKRIVNGIPKHIREKAEIALKVTRLISALLNSPAFNLANAILSLNISVQDKEKVQRALDIAARELDADNIEQLIQHMQSLPDKVRNAVLAKIASIITAALDENERKEHVYDLAVQAVYSGDKNVA